MRLNRSEHLNMETQPSFNQKISNRNVKQITNHTIDQSPTPRQTNVRMENPESSLRTLRSTHNSTTSNFERDNRCTQFG